MAGRLRSSGGGGGSGGLDADAVAWGLAVNAAGGTYSIPTIVAVSNFCTQAKASGYWTKLVRLNLICGDQLAAALVPLKVGGGSFGNDTNMNFVAGDYTEATGLTGNGTTKYLKTGLVPSTGLSANDTHLAIYNRASSGGAGGQGSIGAYSGSDWLVMDAPFSDNQVYSAQYGLGAGLVTSASIGTGARGLIIGTRTASNAHTVYQNGSSIGSNATTAGSLPGVEIYVSARNNAGSAEVFAQAPIAAYSIGAGLSAADVTDYTSHMEAFQDALGRGVI